jgi:hypothetical protein
MITILSAIVCLKAVCYQVTVPTPITIECNPTPTLGVPWPEYS